MYAKTNGVCINTNILHTPFDWYNLMTSRYLMLIFLSFTI